MGVLDDAIREHLELRRSHGAAEDDLRRQEAEALGPARRSATDTDAEPSEAPEAEDSSEAAEPADVGEEVPPDAPWDRELDWADSRRDRDVAASPEGDETEKPSPEPLDETFVLRPDEALEGEDGTQSTAVDDHGPPETERDRVLEEHAEDLEVGGTEAADLRDEEATAAREIREVREDEGKTDEPPAERDDVLEETPDFLQETPEHDRLWFEQKPPRDFDFDE